MKLESAPPRGEPLLVRWHLVAAMVDANDAGEKRRRREPARALDRHVV
jgi:hypothetical protein